MISSFLWDEYLRTAQRARARDPASAGELSSWSRLVRQLEGVLGYSLAKKRCNFHEPLI